MGDEKNNQAPQESGGSTSPPPIVKETKSMIERAEEVAKRVEEANRRAEELLNKNEAVAARIMLSGRAEAGQMPVLETEEQRTKRLAMELMKGTGLNPFR